MIGSVIACPLVCHADQGSARAGFAGGASCCDRCRADRVANPAAEQSLPRHDPSPDSGKPCQCLCGGAIVEIADTPTVIIDTSWSQPCIVVAPLLLAHTHETSFRQFSAVPWPDIGMNPGRALRCLFSTFLC